jgi:hypothetical protein
MVRMEYEHREQRKDAEFKRYNLPRHGAWREKDRKFGGSARQRAGFLVQAVGRC